MASAHGGFAAVTVISESLVNQCLSTYLNTYLNGLTAGINRNIPVAINGANLVFQIKTDAVLVSVRATLKPNAAGRIYLTFRFYANTAVNVLAAGFNSPSGNYNPEIIIDVSVSASLISQVQGDQFQFGVNMSQIYFDAIKVSTLSPGGLPPQYQQVLINTLQDPETRAVLNAVLNSIANQLQATPATVPAFYNYASMKPVQPDEVWFNASIAAGRLIDRPLDGALAIAVDVPGYTNGVPFNLFDFRGNADIASATNLDFVQAYLANAVLPQMRNAFLNSKLRIDKVKRFEFKSRVFDNGTANYIEAEFECTYWTHSLIHFALAGTTGVSGVMVTIQAAPYLVGDQILLQMGKIEADLPDWLDATIFGFSLMLPPVSLFLPAIISSAIHNALVDVSLKLNGQATENGLLVKREFPLPGTAGPTYRFTPTFFRMDCTPGERSVRVGANLRPISTPRLRIIADNQGVNVDTAIERFEIRRNGGLPTKVTAQLQVPPGLIQTKDPTIRVRFETALNGNPVPRYTRDLRFFGNLPATTIGGGVIKPNVLSIDMANIVNPQKLDQEIRITCRLYRSMGGITEDIYNSTAYILSVDPRPDEVKPYVQWAHWVTYWNGYRKVRVIRRSKIHRAPGKGGCRFSNQYLLPSMRSPKFVSLHRFTGLPFEMGDIEANRDKICPYCFFGGPDKHFRDTFVNELDLTGTVGPVFKP